MPSQPCSPWGLLSAPWRCAILRIARTAALLLGVSCLTPTSHSRTDSFSADYTIENWQTEDGLPQSSVLAIEQTPDGYLWLATFGGLVRFDGVRFTSFDTSNLPGLPGNRLVRLSVDREGALWVITEYREVARIKDGHCRTFTAADGVPPEGARWVGDDAVGNRWLAGSQAGLWRWQNERFVPVLTPPQGFTQSPIRAFLTDASGQPWFNHRDGLFRFQDGQLVPLPESAAPPGAEPWPACRSQDGGFWRVSPAGLQKYGPQGWLPQPWPCPEPNAIVVDLREDSAGNLWLATYKTGLLQFHPATGWRHWTTDSGLPTPSLRSLFCDREGNVWVGTDGGGFLRIKSRPWRMITRREGLGIDAVHSICEDPAGRIWFAGGTQRPFWLDQGTVAIAIPPPASDVLDGVWSVLPARDGTMWIGTYLGQVFHYRDGALTGYNKAGGLLAGSVRALFEDHAGTLWVGGFDGLSRIDPDRITHYSQANGLSSDKVWALAEDSRGSLYVGTAGGGLDVLRDDQFTVYTLEHGLPDLQVRSLHIDAEDTVWIGTHGGGLSRFAAGRFFNFAVKGGLPVRSIGPMLEDQQGRLWMASSAGILRMSRTELNEFAAGSRHAISYVAYDRSDGLATIEVGGIQPACLRDRDGRLWFGTTKGAAYVNPADLQANPHPPPVLIEEVLVDDHIVQSPDPKTTTASSAAHGRTPEVRHSGRTPQEPLTATTHTLSPTPSSVTLTPRQRHVEFRFTGLSFTAPAKVRFRYRMQGFDPDWIDGGTRRTASYTRLPPGQYVFHVTACNDSGLWNPTGATLAVIVAPAFHQTGWFRLLALAAVAAIVSALFRLRLSRLKAMARLRARIAGDLHDELGSNLGGIILLSDLARHTPGLPPDALASLREINATAHRTATVMRDIVWFLNPDFDTLADMTARMRECANTLLNGTQHEFIAPELESERRLPLEFRRNLFFAYKEILHNVAKHAAATRVQIRLDVTNHTLLLRVHDNGRGFDPAATTPGHGLRSLHRRTTELRGRLDLTTAPDHGTTVTLAVPLP